MKYWLLQRAKSGLFTIIGRASNFTNSLARYHGDRARPSFGGQVTASDISPKPDEEGVRSADRVVSVPSERHEPPVTLVNTVGYGRRYSCLCSNETRCSLRQRPSVSLLGRARQKPGSRHQHRTRLSNRHPEHSPPPLRNAPAKVWGSSFSYVHGREFSVRPTSHHVRQFQYRPERGRRAASVSVSVLEFRRIGSTDSNCEARCTSPITSEPVRRGHSQPPSFE